MPISYTAIFHGCKNHNFQMKNCDISSQIIDRGYTLEPPQIEEKIASFKNVYLIFCLVFLFFFTLQYVFFGCIAIGRKGHL